MVSGLAHEVKQPLHVLRMTLFNMRQRMNSVGLDGDYLGEKLERMDAQVLRVDRLVSHLGVFSRKSALEALPFDPYAAFEGALGLLGEGCVSTPSRWSARRRRSGWWCEGRRTSWNR